MPFSTRPYRRFPVQSSVTYNAGPFQGQGTVWNISSIRWRLSTARVSRVSDIARGWHPYVSFCNVAFVREGFSTLRYDLFVFGVSRR
jgi:hypothetical protein